MKNAHLDHLTGDNAELVESWPARELADKLASGNPDDDGVVLRVVAARIAQRAEQCEDPGSLLGDLARAVASITLAVSAIAHLEEFEQDDGTEAKATVESAVRALAGAAGGLYAMHCWV